MSAAAGAVLAILLVLAASCATPYKSSGLGGGYRERKISESAYYVTFNGNGYADEKRVFNFWLYRCAELTLERGYSYLVIRTGAAPSAMLDSPLHPAASLPWNSAQLHEATYRDDGRARLIPVKGGGGGGSVFIYGGSSIRTWNSHGTVLMYPSPLPPDLVWALDARVLMSDLQPFLSSNGGTVAPSRDELFRHALSAHDLIGFGGARMTVTAAPQAPGMQPPAPAAVPGKPIAPPPSMPRNANEILVTVDDHRTFFLELFKILKDHDPTFSRGGVVAFHMVISPNGTVDQINVQGSTIQEPRFVNALADTLHRITFAPQDVQTTVVDHFEVQIQPNQAVATRARTTPTETEEKLKELDDLDRTGTITFPEYQARRAAILSGK